MNYEDDERNSNEGFNENGNQIPIKMFMKFCPFLPRFKENANTKMFSIKICRFHSRQEPGPYIYNYNMIYRNIGTQAIVNISPKDMSLK